MILTNEFVHARPILQLFSTRGRTHTGFISWVWYDIVWIQSCYRILPNKRTCLNKHAPEFWIYLAITQTLLNRSQSNFQHIMLGYSGAHKVNFIGIRQGSAFVFCLCARSVYSAKYGRHVINPLLHIMTLHPPCRPMYTMPFYAVHAHLFGLCII